MDPRFRLEKPSYLIGFAVPCGCGCNEEYPPATKRVQRYLQNLIPQMLHSLFIIFTCECENSCNEKSANLLPFHKAAMCLKRQTRLAVICSARIWTGRENLAYKYLRGHNSPNEVVLRLPDLDIKRIWREIE
jgi:hypothetical protein